MRRDIELPKDGGITSVDGQLVEVNLGSISPERIVSELLLLQEGLVEALAIRYSGSQHRVRVTSATIEERAIAFWEDDLLRITVPGSELGYWLQFFLKYYRDDMAEVDHIDVEARNKRKNGSVIDIVLKVSRAKAPVNSDEARRRLWMPPKC